MDPPTQRFEQVRTRIATAARSASRDAASVALLAVSKRHPASAIRALRALGQQRFGENYVSEGVEKILALQDLDLVWHYIGPIQSNKTRAIAEHFDCVETIDRLKVARRLSAQRPPERGDLDVLIQVHIGDEATKAGCDPAALEDLAREVAALDHLRLRGLMCIPPPSDDREQQFRWFAQLRELQEALRSAGLALDTLSMGMTADLEAAIAAGSTEVRIGTALFGPRPT